MFGIGMQTPSRLFDKASKKSNQSYTWGSSQNPDRVFFFRKLNLLKCEDINIYQIVRLVFRVHNNEIPIFRIFFTRNRDVHSYDTRQKIISIPHHLKPN